MREWILVIADDLTGALECGAKFAAQGLTARVTTGLKDGKPSDADVWVMDTETRHLSGFEAARVVRETVRRAAGMNPWLIYKKTDSTLRGNISAEFRALSELFPERSIAYSPAYPAMGRTVREGRLLVDGVPLHETAFAHDPLNPVQESRLATLLEGLPVEVIEGETDAEIDAAAKRILGTPAPVVAAGTGALAGAMAARLRRPDVGKLMWPRIARCLVVNGSLHPASIEQIGLAKRQGCFDGEWNLLGGLEQGYGWERALCTGKEVKSRLLGSPLDALVVFGGDTAFGIHQALGAEPFDSLGELLPGVPLSRSGDLFWITKAGGFGNPEVLCDIRKRLT